MDNSHEKTKVDKIEKIANIVNETVGKEEGIELTKEDIDIVKKANARLNVHIYVREFLIVLVKIAQKHAKENPQSELAGIGMLLIPISKHIIDAIVQEVKNDPEDLIKLIEYFYKKLKAEGFFIDEEKENSENKEED